MKWRGGRKSRNVEDRRRAGRTAGIGGVGALLLLGIGYFLGVDMTPFVSDGGGGRSQSVSSQDQTLGEFSATILGFTEEVWSDIFQNQVGERYQPPVLVLFTGQTASPCGGANGATGPFYCPADHKIYLDTDFFDTLSRQMGAGGDFAAAYVIAHEVAHHVQNLLGVLPKANAVRARSSEAGSNRISVMIELQADCFSGVWGRSVHKKFGVLEKGDVEEAINAARQIGDDTLQRNAGRVPMPHTFTHGTSKQRQEWFARGFSSGDIKQCDSFAEGAL